MRPIVGAPWAQRRWRRRFERWISASYRSLSLQQAAYLGARKRARARESTALVRIARFLSAHSHSPLAIYIYFFKIFLLNAYTSCTRASLVIFL